MLDRSQRIAQVAQVALGELGARPLVNAVQRGEQLHHPKEPISGSAGAMKRIDPDLPIY